MTTTTQGDADLTIRRVIDNLGRAKPIDDPATAHALVQEAIAMLRRADNALHQYYRDRTRDWVARREAKAD